MAKLHLTVATGDHDFIRPLKDREVQADGIELTLLTHMRTPEIVERMIGAREFDVAEIGLNFIVTAAAKGRPSGFTGIAVFPLRRFNHGVIFVNSAAGVRQPSDLRGKRVGAVYHAAGNVWVRGLLQEFHGLAYREVQWVGEPWGLPELIPTWHEAVQSGSAMVEMLDRGQLAAVVRSYISPRELGRYPNIAYLFPDYKARDADYYRRTRIFPILHALIVKREVAERYPWVPTSLIKAFDAARKVALRRPIDARVVFNRAVAEEQDRLMGPDPWPNGLGELNEQTIRTFVRYMMEQEIIGTAPAPREIFAPFDIAGVTADDGA